MSRTDQQQIKFLLIPLFLISSLKFIPSPTKLYEQDDVAPQTLAPPNIIQLEIQLRQEINLKSQSADQWRQTAFNNGDRITELWVEIDKVKHYNLLYVIIIYNFITLVF